MNSKNNHFLIYIFFQIFLFLEISTNTVILHFQELNNNQTDIYNLQNDNLFSNDEDKSYFDELYQNLLYTIINIGTPNQLIMGIFNPNTNIFVISNQDNCYKRTQYNYSLSNSQSLKIIEKIEGDDYFPGHLIINETIKINTIDNSSMKIEEIKNFQLRYDEPKKSWGKEDTKQKIFCADIGFQINQGTKTWAKFFKQLKNKKLINSYIITMNYTNNNEGNFYIGEYPHKYFPNFYNESQLVTTYAIPRTSFSQFRILMDDIYIKINDITQISMLSKEVFFHLELGIIECATEYFNYVKNTFFKKYLNNNTCFIKSMIQNLNSYNMIVCEDSNDFDIISFPSLYFYHYELNMTFSLNFKDLFEKKNNKYYFLIIHSNFSGGYWKLGKPFLKKYQITLNLDAKSISFYNKFKIVENNNIDNIENNKISNSIILIALCLILIVILFIVSYFLFERIKKDKKKRANELNDEYEYNSDSNDGNNNDKSNKFLLDEGRNNINNEIN